MITKKEVMEAAREAEEMCHQWWNSVEALCFRAFVLKEEEEEKGLVSETFHYYLNGGQVTVHCTPHFAKKCLDNGWLTGWAKRKAEQFVRTHMPKTPHYNSCPNCGHDDMRCECM